MLECINQGVEQGDGVQAGRSGELGLLLTAAGAQQDNVGDAGRQAGLQVGEGVANHVGSVEVYIVPDGRLPQQSRLWFAAGTLLVWGMWAHENVVNTAVCRRNDL